MQAQVASIELHNQEKVAAATKMAQETAREAAEALAEANEKLAYESAEHDKAIQELADEMEAKVKVKIFMIYTFWQSTKLVFSNSL